MPTLGNGGANGGVNGGGNGKKMSEAAATAKVDGLIRGGRPPLSMDQVSEFGRALPREMMVGLSTAVAFVSVDP